uniref:Uncharacterized protein n=1 Tax=Arundo donax TaxID=35708 RepID=A0A0A9BSU9_ARUDO
MGGGRKRRQTETRERWRGEGSDGRRVQD